MEVIMRLMFLTNVAVAALAALCFQAGTQDSGPKLDQKKALPAAESNQAATAQGETGGAQGGRVVDDHEKNLSNKLHASGGMIKPPPGVDPQIVKPAPVPEPNSTPVIPPSGVPGGPPGPEPT
jgi:hypothetical protein